MQSSTVAALAGVYYLIPNTYHVLTFRNAVQIQVKHALTFFAVAVVLFLGARVAQNAG